MLKRLVFTAVVVLAGLGLLNVAAVVWEAAPYGAREVNGRPNGLYVDNDVSQRPQLRPGARLRGLKYAVSINSLGFRGPELASPRPEQALRVWCIGGSTTFDIFAPDDDATWPAQLQEVLQRARPDRAVEVINAGIPGEILWGSQQDFERLYDTVRPDVLVVHSGPNDLRKARDFEAPPPPPEAAFGLDLAMLRLLKRALAPYGDPGLDAGFRFETRHLDRIWQEMRPLLDFADARGVRVLLASHALRLSQAPTPEELDRQLGELSRLLRATPAASAQGFARYNAMVERVAAERGHGFADVRAAVPGDGEYWGDATHFAAPGSEIAGRVVAEALLAARLDE